MSLNLESLFKQLQEISAGTNVHIATTPTKRTVEPYYPPIHALPPPEGATTLNIVKGREPGHDSLVYNPVSGELK